MTFRPVPRSPSFAPPSLEDPRVSHSSGRRRRRARSGIPSSAPTAAGAAANAARTAGRLGAIAALALLPGAVLVAPVHAAAAQQPAAGVGRVAGTVLGPTGAPVSNVQVTIVGTRFGNITDEKGKYTIGGVPVGAVTVRAQRIGFQARTQQVTVTAGGVTAADFSLVAAATVLSEVRVQVGYTNEARRDVSGAVSSVSSNEIQDQKVATVEEAIRGRIPGVQVATGGEPGRPAQIVIRGQQTFGDPSPLYVVDGMYVGNINPNINPDDIQNVDVLKDASAAAQYGSQASKGVIVITTKRGRAGTNQFALNTYYGFQDVPKTIAMAGTPEWQRLWLQSFTNAGIPTSQIPGGVTNPTSVNTNWQDQVFQKGAIQNYNLQASGGTPTASYLISGSLLDQQGTVITTKFRRASVRANSQATLGRVTLSENIAASQNNVVGLGAGGTAFYTLIDDVRMLPTIPVRDSTNPSGFGYGSVANPTFGVNPVANLLVNTNNYRSNAVLGSASAQVALFGGLSYRLNGGVDYNDDFNRYFRSIDQIRYRTTNTYATLNQERPNRTNTLVENLLNYDANFGDGTHRITAVGGLSTQRIGYQNLTAYRQGFSNEQLQQINGASNAGLNNSGYFTPFNTNSALGRATYAFRDRYLATASVRQDCSSRFSADNKCGVFGAGSLGWVVSEEGFFKAIPVLGGASQFKLRGSTGVLGDQNIGDFQYVAPLAPNVNYPLGGNIANGSTQTRLVSTNLKWQSNRSSDVGFDLGLLGNTLTVTADYFKNQVTNLLVGIPIPGSLGADPAHPPTVNAGSLNNAGFELGVAHQLTRGALQFNTTFNAAYTKNRVTSLGNGGQPLFQGSYGEAQTAVGNAIGSWYVRKTCGIFQSDAEAQAHTTTVNGKAVVLQPQARAGDVCYSDLNGDGVISDAGDRYVAGNGTPKWTGGLFLNTKYKSLDVGVNLTGKYGFKIFNAVRIQTDRMDDLGGVRAGYTPWTPDNHSTTNPIALFNNNGPSAARATSNVYGLSDRWLEKGDFTRIQNIIVGYTLPQSVLQRLRVGSTRQPRIYVNAQNLYTFTKYTNWDPDVLGIGNALARGEDDGMTYPTPRTVTFGLDVRF